MNLYLLVICLVRPNTHFLKFKCTKSVHISSCSLSPHRSFLKMNTLGASAHLFSLVSGFSYVTPEASLCKHLLNGHWWLTASSSLLVRVDSVSLLAIFRPPPKTRNFQIGPAILRNWNLESI